VGADADDCWFIRKIKTNSFMMGYFVFAMTMEQAAGRQNREDFKKN